MSGMNFETKAKNVEKGKTKDLDEARKSGAIPPELDERGHEINPYIPMYIKSVPWYLNKDKPTLSHQRVQEDHKIKYNSIYDTYKRGQETSDAPIRFMPGSCENCGSRTHKKKDCLERPRKVGAKFTGLDLKSNDIVQPNLKFDYDGKRDHWANYDTSEHIKVVEEFNRMEQLKQKLKSEKLVSNLENPSKEIGVEETPEPTTKHSDFLYDGDKNIPEETFALKQRLVAGSLRIREDTAKYLYNLDLESAYYDPKSRSMRQDPLENLEKSKTIEFKGENTIVTSGDVNKVNKAQVFTWQAADEGLDVNFHADPTKAELLLKQYDEKKSMFDQNKHTSLFEKYGGEEHLHMPPKELLFAQTEEYVEYSKHGKPKNDNEICMIKSKYEEDIYTNNHTSIWGSFWNNFKWGYACCHSFIKNSYCVGLIEKKTTLPKLNDAELVENKEATTDNQIETSRKRNKNKESKHDTDSKPKKTNVARKYESILSSKPVTEEDLEGYLIKKIRPNDPMANYKDEAD